MVLKNKNKENVSDQWLLECYKTSQDASCIGELFFRYVHLVYGVCLRWTKDRQLAQEASMGVLAQLFKWNNAVEIADFKLWLLGVANNYCELFLAEKDTVGFLKEKIGDETMFEFTPEEVIPNSNKSVWANSAKGKISIHTELDKETVALLDGFYLHDKTLDELAEVNRKSAEEIRDVVRVSICRIWQELDDEQRALIKPNSEKHKLRTWDIYLRYFTNEIIGKEKNVFEREVVADPFEYAALVGMMQYAGVSIDADLDILQRRIHRRTGYEKSAKRNNFNVKTWLSLVGGFLCLALLVFFVIRKLTIEHVDEDIPRRIIESEIVTTPNDTGAVFKLGRTDSSRIDSLTKDSIAKRALQMSAVKAKRKQREEMRLDTFQPLPALSLHQVDLGLEKGSSPVFVDMQSDGQNVFKLAEQPEVRFEPEGGLVAYKRSLKDTLAKASIYPQGGCKIRVVLDASGAIKAVEVLNNDDASLKRKIEDVIKSNAIWKLVEGKVEMAEEYSHQIEF